MQTKPRSRLFWATPAVGAAIGVVYLVAFWIGGQLGEGVVGLVVMLVAAVAFIVLGSRYETIRGLLDHRDERLAGIDLRATAVTAIAMIVAALTGFVVEVARGHDGQQFALVAAVGGLAYLSSVAWLMVRR